MLKFIKSPMLPWVLAVLAIGYLGYLFYSERTKQKQEDTKQAAIVNPAKTKAEVITREVVKTVTREGDTKVVTKEVIRTVAETKPSYPETNTRRISKYYLSGACGITNFDFSRKSYAIGAGYNFTDMFSAGVRYDQFGRDYRIGLEIRVNF